MIQEGLGIIWKRILTLKYLLILTIGFNVLAATSGVVCSIYLWNGAFDLSKKVLAQHETQLQLSQVLVLASELQNSNQLERMSRTEALKEMQLWERLRLQIDALGLQSAKSFPMDYITQTASVTGWLEIVKSEILTAQESQRAEVLALATREHTLTQAVIWVAALTLIFGVALPLIIFSLLLKALRAAQKALTETAKDIVHDWSTAMSRHGEDPFKNAHFWIEALLIFSEQLGAQSRHPAALLSAELSYLVRNELHKAQKNAA